MCTCHELVEWLYIYRDCRSKGLGFISDFISTHNDHIQIVESKGLGFKHLRDGSKLDGDDVYTYCDTFLSAFLVYD